VKGFRIEITPYHTIAIGIIKVKGLGGKLLSLPLDFKGLTRGFYFASHAQIDVLKKARLPVLLSSRKLLSI
jgi:hypothetical protein